MNIPGGFLTRRDQIWFSHRNITACTWVDVFQGENDMQTMASKQTKS